MHTTESFFFFPFLSFFFLLFIKNSVPSSFPFVLWFYAEKKGKESQPCLGDVAVERRTGTMPRGLIYSSPLVLCSLWRQGWVCRGLQKSFFFLGWESELDFIIPDSARIHIYLATIFLRIGMKFHIRNFFFLPRQPFRIIDFSVTIVGLISIYSRIFIIKKWAGRSGEYERIHRI